MKKDTEPKYHCPDCHSADLLAYEQTSFDLNTGDFYCHSVKMFDPEARIRCYKGCGWEGRLNQVINTEKGI
jgi:hypothetical protein